ncbi:hypothetical protein KSP40_PGU001038 [Platanthera guangdongensis]|uniref:Uncharacterized protein n=1 Tax=Platanthera guangdongensis TaxID=2320717 RepID=A0ABR2M2Q3_9ASPA
MCCDGNNDKSVVAKRKASSTKMRERATGSKPKSSIASKTKTTSPPNPPSLWLKLHPLPLSPKPSNASKYAATAVKSTSTGPSIPLLRSADRSRRTPIGLAQFVGEFAIAVSVESKKDGLQRALSIRDPLDAGEDRSRSMSADVTRFLLLEGADVPVSFLNVVTTDFTQAS